MPQHLPLRRSTCLDLRLGLQHHRVLGHFEALLLHLKVLLCLHPFLPVDLHPVNQVISHAPLHASLPLDSLPEARQQQRGSLPRKMRVAPTPIAPS